jgi:hypothetical protein
LPTGNLRLVVKDEYDLWNDLVEKSPQGTVFSTTQWMEALEKPFEIYGYFKGDSLLGGIIGTISDTGLFASGGFNLTPFQGILIAPMPDAKPSKITTMQHEVASAVREKLKPPFKIYHHYTFPDIRPHTNAEIRYTYVVKLDNIQKMRDRLDKKTRWEMKDREAVIWGKGYKDDFGYLYQQTFARKGMDVPVPMQVIKNICNGFNAQTFISYSGQYASSGVVMISDSKRLYYILGASDGSGTSTYCLWTALKELFPVFNECDLVGCNDPKIAQFKKGFGGDLKVYFGINL